MNKIVNVKNAMEHFEDLEDLNSHMKRYHASRNCSVWEVSKRDYMELGWTVSI